MFDRTWDFSNINAKLLNGNCLLIIEKYYEIYIYNSQTEELKT